MAEVERLFVYGTLMREYGNTWARLLWQGGTDLGAATMPGRMYNLGGYPGLLDAESAADLVHGQVVEISGAAEIFRRLDVYEGREYRREIREAAIESGERVAAWVYVYTGRVREAQRIADGRWRERGYNG